MAKQFQFETVKEFLDNFRNRADGTIWINGVKNHEDFKSKIKTYDANKEFSGARVEDDQCGNFRLRFNYKGEKFMFLSVFRGKDVQLQPNV